MKAWVQQNRDEILRIFHHLHSNPELSWEEHETTAFIQQQLKALGYTVTTFPDTPGLIAELGSGQPIIGIRADMDALWQEVDGIYQANHSCGHDAHMTMVLGSLYLLKQLGFPRKGTIRAIFQPAEEAGTGAKKMVELNAIEDLDYLFGVHVRPLQEVENGKAAPAIHHGAATFLHGEIIGVDAHGARPHQGTNAIEVGVAIVQHIGQIHVDPAVPSSIKMTQFATQNKNPNVIPGYAAFSLDLRAQSNQVMDMMLDKVSHIVETLAALYQVQIRLKTGAQVVAAEINENAVDLMEQAIIATIGKENLVPSVITTGGEDFHFYTRLRPELKATMLGLGCGLTPGLHHPEMTFDRDAIFTGIEILARAVLYGLEEGKLNNDELQYLDTFVEDN